MAAMAMALLARTLPCTVAAPISIFHLSQAQKQQEHGTARPKHAGLNFIQHKCAVGNKEHGISDSCCQHYQKSGRKMTDLCRFSKKSIGFVKV